MGKSLYDHCIERGELNLLEEWDVEKNGELTPNDVSKGSHRKIWWKCKLGHHWQAAIYTRTGQYTGCPYCKGKKTDHLSRNLAVEYPELIKEWNYEKNIGVKPEELNPGTHRKVWWKCSKGHEWLAEVKSRTKGSSCPICSNRKVKPGENDLSTVCPAIAAQWHPIKNGSLSPKDVVAGNHSKVWWLCEKGHEWQATIISRTANGSGCPVCAGKMVIKGENDLASTYPAIAAQWHPTKNGLLTPEQVTPFSNKKVWWKCSKGHEFFSTIAHRTQNSTDCPYCTNRKVLAGFNDLATVEPQIAAQWHLEMNGDLTPQMVTSGSRKKVWWKCSEGHVWKAVVYSRAGSQKCGCPVCSGKVKGARQFRYTNYIDSELRIKF